MKRALGRLDAVGRVGEIDEAVGPADDVVGAVEPLARPGLDERLHAAAVASHPRDAPAVLLAEDDAAVRAEGLAVGRPGVLPQQLDRTVGIEPVGPLGLVVLEQQRAVGAPERALGELETPGQAFDGSALSTSSESPASLRISAIDRTSPPA